MTQCRFYQQTGRDFSRRGLIKGVAAVAGVATIGTRFALAQSTQTAATPPSTVTNPPRDFGPGAPPVTYPDSDIVTTQQSCVCGLGVCGRRGRLGAIKASI
jgi:gluconolactonase